MHTAKLPFHYLVSLWTTNNSCSHIDTSLDEASADPASSACRNRLVSQALAVAGPISSRDSNNGSAIASSPLLSFTRPSARPSDLRRADVVHYFPSGRPWRRARETN